MGVVYRARQLSLDRVVALKMILAGSFGSREQAMRLRLEAEAAAKLQHPNIVRIYETGEYEGQPFFSMDHLEGGDLATLVRLQRPPIRRAAGWVKTIAEAIDYAHGQGILHRDLKPSNILLDRNGEPRITDFGLARRVDTPLVVTMTVTGQVVGSPNFMPPEQASPKRGKSGPASDVYGLGGILFYLLTGRPPFLGETVVETLRQVTDTEAISPRLLNPEVPRDLATICLKCLEKDPGRRYATARGVGGGVGAVYGGRIDPGSAVGANGAGMALVSEAPHGGSPRRGDSRPGDIDFDWRADGGVSHRSGTPTSRGRGPTESGGRLRCGCAGSPTSH
jgi:serine/threonine protein kinase